MTAPGKKNRSVLRVLLRLLLVLVTAGVLLAGGLWVILRQIFCGPSPAARDALTLSLMASETTSWIPGLFLEDDLIAQIQESADSASLSDVSDPSLICPATEDADWQAYPDGIRVEEYRSEGFTAHILLIRNPEQISMSHNAAGSKIADQLRAEGAAAGIYAPAGEGLRISRGNYLSDHHATGGFAGFTEDGILILAGSMTTEDARTLSIRDGGGCGLILILNGQINEGAYNANSGYAPRVCMGQRADGSLVLLTIDGLSADSIGGTYRNCIDILYEYGCINACCLDGVPAAMLHEGRMIHCDALPRAESAVMTDFWIVRSGKEG